MKRVESTFAVFHVGSCLKEDELRRWETETMQAGLDLHQIRRMKSTSRNLMFMFRRTSPIRMN